MVLLDTSLDGEHDGIALAHELRAVRPVPIIFLTSFDDKVTFGRAKLARHSAYLLKPQDAPALESVLLNFTDGQTAPLRAFTAPPTRAMASQCWHPIGTSS